MSLESGSFLAVLFKRAVLFFADSRRKKGFQPIKSLYCCEGQQKKKKNCLKRIAILEHVNRLNAIIKMLCSLLRRQVFSFGTVRNFQNLFFEIYRIKKSTGQFERP